ncbi:MAG: DNA polymerase/3'-5' exonuclease PolX [Desulfurivibrionaceae bacterium]
MSIHNTDIARIFKEVADLLEIKGENQFRVRAYRNAARTMESLSHEAIELIKDKQDLTSIPGIGKDLAEKIRTIVESGSLPLHDRLHEELPRELIKLLAVESLGPKKVSALYNKLGIDSLEALSKAAESGKIRQLSGFGVKSEQKILDDLKRPKEGAGRIKLADAEEFAEPLRDYLSDIKEVNKATVAGSYRRHKETVGDLDILVTCQDGPSVMDKFTVHEDVARILSRGETRSSVILRSGLQVDLRVVPEKSYGAALHYFTGSKAHNIAIRKIAIDQGLKVNEYGIFKGNSQVAGATEEEFYQKIGISYIEPELREGRGEIEAAAENNLPQLIRLTDIKGDLHSHSKATDGRNTLKEMAEAARELGYEYLAITDHSQRVTVAGGLDEKRLRQEMEEIDRLNENIQGITLLKGIEVDILKDGSLDLADSVLRELDIVVGSVHSYFNLPSEKQTERLIRAMDNRNFNILGHPTGRMIGTRNPYDVDLEKVMREAAKRGVHLELNAQPDRLDLSDIHVKTAGELGVLIAISTDAHLSQNLHYMRFGVYQARRGWLEADNVLNSRSLAELRKLLKR